MPAILMRGYGLATPLRLRHLIRLPIRQCLSWHRLTDGAELSRFGSLDVGLQIILSLVFFSLKFNGH